jgi:hypothetical protein
MKKTTLKLVDALATAKTYRFVAADRDFGWANCTVNDATGELAIISDWGSWSYIWNPKYLGCPSLTDFLAGRERNGDYAHDYIATKLLGRNGAYEFDGDATIKRWRKDLAERRLSYGRSMPYERAPSLGRRPVNLPELTAAFARDLWDEIGSLYDASDNVTLFLERAYQIDGLSYVTDEPWEHIEHSPSGAYRDLTEIILPALCAACTDEIARTRAERAWSVWLTSASAEVPHAG